MTNAIICPRCQRALGIRPDQFGQLVRCSDCSHEFSAPLGQSLDYTTDIPPVRSRPDKSTFIAESPVESEPTLSRPALPRPRPFERDLDDDEWDRSDGEQFRRRGAWFMASARTKVAGPANGLFAVGLINLALSGFYVIINTGNGAAFFKNQDVDPLVINLVVNAIRIALSIFTVIAAQKMKKLQSLRMVKAAAILTMIPFVSPCCILGLVFGIQAMNVLGDADIGRAFARQATNPDSEF